MKRILFSASQIMITFLLLSGVASAIQVQVSYIKLSGAQADFGNGLHVFGVPSDNGVVTYDFTTSNGQLMTTGRVRGSLYWDALFSSGCARLTIKYRDSSNNNLSTTTRTICGPGGNANDADNQLAIDESFASVNLNNIVVSANEVRNGQLIAGDSTTVTAPFVSTFLTAMQSSSSSAAFLDFLPDQVSPSPVPEKAVVQFDRSFVPAGQMFAGAWGRLVTLSRGGCVRSIVDFRSETGAVLDSRTDDTCTEKQVAEGSLQGVLPFQVRVRVGEVGSLGVFQNVLSRTFNFAGQVGNFEVEPAQASVSVGEVQNLEFTWSVPEQLTWHDLNALQLRIADDEGAVLWVKFDEASNSFSVYNDASRRFGHGFPAGGFARLETRAATLYLPDTNVTAVNSVLGNGANSPGVRLTLPISFKPSAAGRTFRVEVAASDDSGNEDPFAVAGTVAVAP